MAEYTLKLQLSLKSVYIEKDEVDGWDIMSAQTVFP